MKMSYAYESPAQRRNRREFTRFSKALTSSPCPVGHARCEVFHRRAQHGGLHAARRRLAQASEASTSAERSSPPPRFLTLLRLQIKSGKQKGQWHKTPELVELLVGTCRIRPMGSPSGTDGAGMAFRRHPHLHDRVRKAHEMAEYWVPDPWLIRTARDMLPSDGSCDFVGTEVARLCAIEKVDQRA